MFTLVTLHEFVHAHLRTTAEADVDEETDRIRREVFDGPSPDIDEIGPSQHGVEAEITC